MSYARFGWDGSDVYIYEHVGGFIECCGCSITEPDGHEDFGFFHAQTAREILTHIDKHIAQGDHVPDDCISRIKKEHPDLDAQIPPYVQTPEEREATRKRFLEIMEKHNGKNETNGL